MSNQLSLQVKLAAIDKMSAPIKAVSASVQKLGQNILLLEEQKRKLSQQQQLVESFKKLKGTTSEVANKLQEAQTKAQALAKQLGATSSPTKRLQQSFERAKKAVQKLKTEQQNHLIKLQRTRQALQESGMSTKNLGAAQADLSHKLKLTNENIDRQKRALNQLNQIQAVKQKQPQHRLARIDPEAQYRASIEQLRNKSERLRYLGQSAMMGGLSMATPVGKAVKDFMELEDVMAGVARQVQGLKDESGKFTPEYDVWKNKIQALSKELPLTTTEIGKMVEAGARMDIAKENLEEFVRLSTQMATAFDAANPDELTENFGKVSKNWNLTQEKTRELADTINYLDDNAISKGDAIIGFMNRLGGIGAVAKITDKNVAALGSTLMTFGSDESSAANAVSSTFSRLSRATSMKPVRNGLKSLGLDPKKIQKGMVQDAQGTLLSVVEKVKQLPKELQSSVLTDIVGGNYGDEIVKLVANTDEWKRQIKLANDEMAKGSMSREFETRMTTLSAKWQIFKNQLFNTNSAIGGTLKETLVGLMDSLTVVLNKVNAWIQANPELAASLAKWVILGGSALVILGGISSILSFLFYPIARLALGFGKITGASRLFSWVLFGNNQQLEDGSRKLRKFNKALLSGRTTWQFMKSAAFGLVGWVKSIPNKLFGVGVGVMKLESNIRKFFPTMKTWGFWWNALKTAGRVALSPIRLLLSGIGTVLSTLVSPIGLLAIAFVTAGGFIYKYWAQIKSFFGGLWQGLKEGLAPVIEKFKPLGDLLGVVVGWVKKAWKWFTDLLTPVETTQKGLDEAASAGKKFGEWLAAGIDLVTKPLQWLMDAIAWVKGQMPEMEESAKRVNGNIAASATKATEIATMIVPPQVQTQAKTVQDKTIPSKGHARGGFTGAGGKYDPAGIVHRGEYVMTKETTARLGVANLNRLNYGGVGGLAAVAAMASGVALAQPMAVKVDNRPLLSAPAPKAASGGLSQNISITINASPNQSEREIARLVQQELVKAQHQAKARNRSSLRDRG